MSHQSVLARLNEKKVSGPSPSQSPVQSSSGICIKQEYFEDQLLMTRTIKTEFESPPNEHNIMQSIKVEVKDEYYDDQDCVVKCELDFDEGEQINRKIKVKVEDESAEQSVQHVKCVKKEEDENGGEYVMECDCEECEVCRVKMEMKEELDESGFETELGRNNVEGCTSVKKEEGKDDDEVDRPNKIRRMDRLVGSVPIGSSSPSPTVYSHNVVSINVEGLDDQVATSSTNAITIEDHTQPCQPVTIPLPTSIVTHIQSASSQHLNKPLRDELLNTEPMMNNVGRLVEVRADEYDREQIDQDDEDDGDQSIENQREDTSAAGGQQVQQVLTENFVKQIEPADELGNRFECDYQKCGRRMKQKGNMIRHIRSHTGEKPFECTVEGCDRAFFKNAQLKDHLNVHSGDRPFVCTWPRCEARFVNKANLTAHLRTHTGERPFQCDQCVAKFTCHSHLTTHLRTHTGSRPFICTWPNCGQAFTQSSHLKTHSLVHLNERQFSCDAPGCTKVYKRMGELRRHQKDKYN